MADFDPRTTPARGDLAARHLLGQVEADNFAQGKERQVISSSLPIRKTPDAEGPQETQALFGESFTVYEEQEGWAWGQARYDGYVGYVQTSGLTDTLVQPTHRVIAPRTYVFSNADLKSAPLRLVSMGAQLRLGQVSGPYREEARGGWVWQGHTAAVESRGGDPVHHAESFLGAPYFWGGRESLGLDCSALIQNAWGAVGIVTPRDADQQEHYFSQAQHGVVLWREGSDQPWTELSLQRGDLIYWPGHTGVMSDEDVMVHANATHMATTQDDLREISARWVKEKELKVRTIIRPLLG